MTDLATVWYHFQVFLSFNNKMASLHVAFTLLAYAGRHSNYNQPIKERCHDVIWVKFDSEAIGNWDEWERSQGIVHVFGTTWLNTNIVILYFKLLMDKNRNL